MSGTILFVASNPTAIKFDFAGELTAIREASSNRSVPATGAEAKPMREDFLLLLPPG